MTWRRPHSKPRHSRKKMPFQGPMDDILKRNIAQEAQAYLDKYKPGSAVIRVEGRYAYYKTSVDPELIKARLMSSDGREYEIHVKKSNGMTYSYIGKPQFMAYGHAIGFRTPDDNVLYPIEAIYEL